MYTNSHALLTCIRGQTQLRFGTNALSRIPTFLIRASRSCVTLLFTSSKIQKTKHTQKTWVEDRLLLDRGSRGTFPVIRFRHQIAATAAVKTSTLACIYARVWKWQTLKRDVWGAGARTHEYLSGKGKSRRAGEQAALVASKPSPDACVTKVETAASHITSGPSCRDGSFGSA